MHRISIAQSTSKNERIPNKARPSSAPLLHLPSHLSSGQSPADGWSAGGARCPGSGQSHWSSWGSGFPSPTDPPSCGPGGSKHQRSANASEADVVQTFIRPVDVTGSRLAFIVGGCSRSGPAGGAGAPSSTQSHGGTSWCSRLERLTCRKPLGSFSLMTSRQYSINPVV